MATTTKKKTAVRRVTKSKATKTKTNNHKSGIVFDTSSFPGPDDVTRVVLPNGIVVLARENFSSPATVFDGSLVVGSLDEPQAQSGLAQFTAACLMRGNEKRSFAEIYEQIESIGARLSFHGGAHTTGFGGKSLAEDLDLLLSLAADALRRPYFPPDHIAHLRGEILTGLAIHAQDTGYMASSTFDALLYPNHPYGRDDDGTPETVTAITRDDLIKFHKTYFAPKGMIITIVGAVKTAEAVALVEKHFGDWSASRPERLPLPSAERLKVIQRKTSLCPARARVTSSWAVSARNAVMPTFYTPAWPITSLACLACMAAWAMWCARSMAWLITLTARSPVA